MTVETHLGHVYRSSTSRVVWGCPKCALAAGYVASLFIGTGRTPYDHAAATRVVRSPAAETSGATR